MGVKLSGFMFYLRLSKIFKFLLVTTIKPDLSVYLVDGVGSILQACLSCLGVYSKVPFESTGICAFVCRR